MTDRQIAALARLAEHDSMPASKTTAHALGLRERELWELMSADLVGWQPGPSMYITIKGRAALEERK